MAFKTLSITPTRRYGQEPGCDLPSIMPGPDSGHICSSKAPPDGRAAPHFRGTVDMKCADNPATLSSYGASAVSFFDGSANFPDVMDDVELDSDVELRIVWLATFGYYSICITRKLTGY